MAEPPSAAALLVNSEFSIVATILSLDAKPPIRIAPPIASLSTDPTAVLFTKTQLSTVAFRLFLAALILMAPPRVAVLL